MDVRFLPVGAKLSDAGGGLSFLVAAQDHPGYGGTTLISERVIRVAPFDASEPQNPGRQGFDNIREFGSNDFATSNLYQWLNAAGLEWYRPAHQWDAPPDAAHVRHGANSYANAPGFISLLSKSLANAILVSAIPLIRKTAGGKNRLRNFQAKVFLPSRTEVGLESENGLNEGFPLPLFRDFRVRETRLSRQAFDSYNSPWRPGTLSATDFQPDSIWRWWLRTPHPRYAYLVRYIEFGMSYAPAFSDIVGVRPMMNVNPGLSVSDKGEPGNKYRILEGNNQ